MGDLIRDLRYTFRMLTKNPLFSIIAILTLALGIGLNAATFSAVHGLLLAPLRGAEQPERLVQIYRHWPGLEYGSVSIPHYQDLRDRTDDVFENTAAWYFTPMSLSTEGRSERLLGTLTSANFFQTYGVVPALGRAFIPGVEDEGRGAHPVVVLGYSFWQSRFGGDPDVVGQTIGINGAPYEVVGVAPAEFRGPMSVSDIPLYVPLVMSDQIEPGSNRFEERGNNMMNGIARLRDGVTLEQAGERLEAILVQLREEYPDHYDTQLGHALVLQSEAGLHPMMRNAQVGMSAVMMAVVSLLLLIACVNVANLFLARARERRREMGMRISLGAGRLRIARQLLTESVVFSLLAGLAGVGLAHLATDLLSQIELPIDGPLVFDVRLDATVLWFTFGISVLAGLVFGMFPALQSTRRDTLAAVKGEVGGKGGSSRVSRALVVAQMALSLILLISSGLFLRSLQGATEIDPGFDEPRSLVMASMDPGLQGYDEARTGEFYDRLVEEIGALAEVRSAGLTDTVPLGLSGSDRGVAIPGYEFAEGERRSLMYAQVGEGYLETMGVDLLEGRTFSRRDDANAAPVIIVNQRFAERFWPGESAIGKIVETAGAERQVVGVVENGKYRTLGEVQNEFMYLPYRERPSSGMILVARTPADPQGVLRRIRETVRSLDPELPVFDVRSMEDHMGMALLPARLGGSVLGLFGVLGLVLAAVGIYGVMAYSVAQRRRELGLRVALGADRVTVVRLVLREGMRLAVVGAAIGLVGALGAAQLLEGLLYNVSALDPVAFVVVPVVLLCVATLAVYLPARRAAAIDPMRVLKVE